MRRDHRGIAVALVVVTMVIIVAVAGVGTFVLLATGAHSATTVASTSGVASQPSSSVTASTSSTVSKSTSASLSSTASTVTGSTGSSSVSCQGAIPEPNVVPLMLAYPSMTLDLAVDSYPSLTSYNVLYASTSTVKVNIDYNGTTPDGNSSEDITAWMLMNGTAIAFYAGGYNSTGSDANNNVIGVLNGLYLEAGYGSFLSNFTSSSRFQETGTSQNIYGPTTLSVTNYTLAAPPVTTTACLPSGGGTLVVNVTQMSLTIASPPGVSPPLITVLSESGTATATQLGISLAVTYSLRVESVTVA